MLQVISYRLLIHEIITNTSETQQQSRKIQKPGDSIPNRDTSYEKRRLMLVNSR